MQKKKLLVMSSLLVAIVLLGIGTIAYFRRTVNGDITGQTGNLVLIVNEADAVANESFEVILQRSEEENFIMPDDKGVFYLNIDSTGSSSDVEVTITISRTNLPDNLRFYLDSNYNEELTTKTYIIEKSDDMTKTVPVYWFWDGSISDEADSEFINKTISANISVVATNAKTFYETLLAMEHVLDTTVDFDQGASETNGQGLMMLNTTQNDEYPVLYYRGDVANNNVIYAGYCWLIVRTTETGGIKLIYNGEVNEDGSCSNYSNVTVEGVNNGVSPTISAPELQPGEYDEFYYGAFINLERCAFNTNYNSPVYVGYMYNDTNMYFDGSTKTLDSSSYLAHLSDNTIDSTTGRHIQNLKDSTIKGVIDAWYASNIDGKLEENLLEDTVWCADRSVRSSNFPIENYNENNLFTYSSSTKTGAELFLSAESVPEVSPSLSCVRDVDKFTVDRENGNGDLIHPVGMLTADEILMAGNTLFQLSQVNTVITYLSIPNNYYWSLSPGAFIRGLSFVFHVNFGELGGAGVGVNEPSLGVRPSISLSNETYITRGNGTFENPYQVG